MALEGLADTLQLPHNDSSEAMVRACTAVLEQKISADARARAEARSDRNKAKGRQQPAPNKFSLQDFPPGFDTGDEQLNKVCEFRPRAWGLSCLPAPSTPSTLLSFLFQNDRAACPHPLTLSRAHFLT